jgi:CubicO group peptidase (beta-lactamase class C family)
MATEILNRYVDDYRLFIKTDILNPLLMSSTTFSQRQAERSGNLSKTWEGLSNREIPYWLREPETDVNLGPGGLISNVNDMVSRSVFSLEGHESNEGTVLGQMGQSCFRM